MRRLQRPSWIHQERVDVMDGGIGVEKFVRYHLKAVIACHGFANQMLQNRSAGGLIGVVLYPSNRCAAATSRAIPYADYQGKYFED